METLNNEQVELLSNFMIQYGLLIGIILLALTIFMIATFWKLFTKAGIEGWKSIIPYYNFYLMTVVLAKKPNWWFWVILASSILSL